MAKFLSKKTNSALLALSFLILGAASSFAEVLRPIQILFPGNINGNLITFTADNEHKGSDAFKLPTVIEKFCHDPDKDAIIFGLGNDSNAFKAFSFLNKGKAERELIAKCNPVACGVSPNDLEVFNSSYLSADIKQRIFTNVEAPDYAPIFERYSVTNLNGSDFYFFNFISPEYGAKLPLSRWSELRIDDPCRALRKANIKPGKKDYTISVVYGDKFTIDELTEEFKALDGIHFIVNVPINDELPIFSYVRAEGENDNVFRFSVQPGHLSLPILNIIPKNAGYPRTTLRMIPLARYEHDTENDVEAIWQQVREEFHKPLKVVPATNRATTSANRISLQAHAEMLRYATTAELAFLKLPKQTSFTESVITVGNSITRFPNDRIVKFKATETQLKNMFLDLLQSSNIKQLGFSGCQFSVLGINYWDFQINKHSVNKQHRYSVATTETTANEFVVKNLIKTCEIEPYNGLTLWQVWMENFRSFKAPEEKLFSN